AGQGRCPPGAPADAGSQGLGRRRPGRDGRGLTMAIEPGDELRVLPDHAPARTGMEVYGAPRPAVPQRLPLTPRFGGCASGAGVGLGVAAQGAGFRRLPEWLKVKLPGSGDYAETRALLKRAGLHTVCEEARCPNLG